jgi:hypothetical protein
MAVIINEFEVITETARAPGDAASAAAAPPQPPPPVTPEIITAIYRREQERGSRVYAG